jgi:hypothetical protein
MKQEQLTEIANSGKIEVALRPDPFAGNSYMDNTDCPLARAAKRHFGHGHGHISAGSVTLKVCDENFRDLLTLEIADGFGEDDHDLIKGQYGKDPEMRTHFYSVTLRPIRCSLRTK